MNFFLTAVQPPEAGALTLIGGLYVGLGISALNTDEAKPGRDRLLVAALLGVGLSVGVFLASGFRLLWLADLVLLGLVILSLLTPVLVRGLRDKQWRWPQALSARRPRLRVLVIFGLGLLLVAGAAAAGAALFGSGPHITTVTPSGRYRIAGTCANGFCYVNQCKTPAVCGNDNEGTLEEETAVDIVCQTKGGMATSPGGKHSKVWDRLSTRTYVSDLFVSGTRDGRFAKNIPRCAGG